MSYGGFEDENGAPCCAAVVTSGRDEHEPGCPNELKRSKS